MYFRDRHAGKILVLATGTLLLAACGSDVNVTPVATEPDIVTAKLQLAAQKAADALDTIAKIDQERTPVSPAAENLSAAPPNLTQAITVRWSGPIEEISKSLADRAGLRFRIKGSIPPVPLTVTIDAYQEPLIHVLRDVGLQAGQRADVAVDAQDGVIEIRYAPADKI